MVSTNTNGQPETFGGITSTEEGPALTALVVPRGGKPSSNVAVSVLVDSGASIH